MLIAIPTANGRLHAHFGGCREFTLVDVDPSQKTTLRTDRVAAPEHQPGLFPRWLRERGVQVVIAGGIGQRALDNFARHGIRVCAGPLDAEVTAVVAAYLEGQLTHTPEGCAHHEDHHHHGHHHHEHTEGPGEPASD